MANCKVSNLFSQRHISDSFSASETNNCAIVLNSLRPRYMVARTTVWSLLLVIFSVGEIFFPVYARAQEYIGRVAVEWIESEGPDREMRLLEDFSFRDQDGTEWTVPAGSKVDGASIPRTFWAIVGPPFVGDYRRASVIHDHYCNTKERP